jgi:hypothetical protein
MDDEAWEAMRKKIKRDKYLRVMLWLIAGFCTITMGLNTIHHRTGLALFWLIIDCFAIYVAELEQNLVKVDPSELEL